MSVLTRSASRDASLDGRAVPMTGGAAPTAGGAEAFARDIAAHAPSARACLDPWECDAALRWLMASDRVVSEQAGRALVEVKASRPYLKEGHA
jgi:hypothetical protein